MQAFYAFAHQSRNQVLRNAAESKAAQHDCRAVGDIRDRFVGTGNNLVHRCSPRAAIAEAAFDAGFRPSFSEIVRPTATNFSRSTPVSIPMPFSM